MINKKIGAYVKLIAAVIIWGTSYHTAKYLVTQEDVYSVIFMRYLLTLIILVPIYLYKNGINGLSNKTVFEWKLLLFLGLIGVFGYNLFFFSAEVYIPANQVAILYAFTPCLTMLLGVMFLKNKINLIGCIGIILSAIGAIMLVLVALPKTGVIIKDHNEILLGQVFAFLAILCMSVYSILNKKTIQIKADSFTLVTFSSCFGFIFITIAFLAFGNPLSALFHEGIKFWVAMLYTSIFITILSYKWYSDAICQIGVGRSAIFLNGVPLSTVLCGILFLGEQVSAPMLIFGTVIIVGVLTVNFSAISPKNRI